MLRFVVALLFAIPALAAPVPKDATPRKLPPNSNALLKAHGAKVTQEASSVYNGWPLSHLFDGEPTTTWFSASNDAPMNGKTPWVQATFPEAVKVSRVTILGVREASYPNGYFVTEGHFEFLDDKGEVLLKHELKSAGEKHDFDYELKHPLAGVKSVRFTCTKDENRYSCIGLAEMQIE